MTDERRQAHRHPTRIEVDYAAESTFLFAFITDISALGIFIESSDPLPTGTKLSLRFSPPSQVHGEVSKPKESFDVSGVVTWVADDDDEEHRGMGIRFEELEPDARKRLMELIHALAYLDDANR